MPQAFRAALRFTCHGQNSLKLLLVLQGCPCSSTRCLRAAGALGRSCPGVGSPWAAIPPEFLHRTHLRGSTPALRTAAAGAPSGPCLLFTSAFSWLEPAVTSSEWLLMAATWAVLLSQEEIWSFLATAASVPQHLSCGGRGVWPVRGLP